jgi:hypothetical protein
MDWNIIFESPLGNQIREYCDKCLHCKALLYTCEDKEWSDSLLCSIDCAREYVLDVLMPQYCSFPEEQEEPLTFRATDKLCTLIIDEFWNRDLSIFEEDVHIRCVRILSMRRDIEKIERLVSVWPYIFKYIPKNLITRKMCNYVDEILRYTFRHIPKKFKTQGMCDEAVQIETTLLRYVPRKFKTYEMCEAALSWNPSLADAVPRRFNLR